MVNWVPEKTEDGSFTFFSEEFQEMFHSRMGAKTEAFEKFAEITDLAQRAKSSHIKLLDVCFGLGYNTAAAIETIWSANPNCHIEVYGLEIDATVPQAAILPPLIDSWSPPVKEILTKLALDNRCVEEKIKAELLIGDARQTIETLVKNDFKADAIFFDPFSPKTCPQLWTVEFFEKVTKCLAIAGKLTTYSRSASVRRAMQNAGLYIGTIPLGENHLPHEWSLGTVGCFNPQTLHPLSPMELEHLQTRASVPFRDPKLTDTAEEIVKRHRQEQEICQLESTSSWRRRWNIT
jgi:tRNA U34 5-methylaminomethyl-2-thiouridine-forming methyltransferase MnmC